MSYFLLLSLRSQFTNSHLFFSYFSFFLFFSTPLLLSVQMQCSTGIAGKVSTTANWNQVRGSDPGCIFLNPIVSVCLDDWVSNVHLSICLIAWDILTASLAVYHCLLLISYFIISYQIMFYLIVLYHITSYHIMSYHPHT